MKAFNREITLKKIFQRLIYPLAIVVNSGQLLASRGLPLGNRFKLLYNYLLIQFHPGLKTGHKFGDLIQISLAAIESFSQGKKNGVLAECGCWEGAASAKLSLLAEMIGWKLYVFDSFEGLPAPSQNDYPLFKKGMYQSQLSMVKNNVEKFGTLKNVEFIQGWFENSLPNFKEDKFDIVFVDADLVSSIKTCIKYIYPQLNRNGRIFLHEAHLDSTVKIFEDNNWWRSNLSIDPLKLFGAGTGLGLGKEWLGYIRN